MKTIKLLFAMLALSWGAAAGADTYPSRPISLIVPFPAGGATDVQIRSVAQIASRHLGQQVVIINKPGAGGALGAVTLASAAPDGYTLSQIPVGVFRQVHMTKMPYDPAKLSYIMGLSGYLFGAVVRTDAPWKSFEELLVYAKANPGKVRFGTIGVGSVQHTTMEAVAEQRGIDWLHVPYKGNAETNMALMSGEINVASDGSGWAGFVESGKFRLLVTYGEKRSRNWPNVPTLKELGFNISERSPYGLAGPGGMDPAHMAVVHDAFKKALYDPEHQKVLERLNQEVIYMTGKEFAEHAAKQSEVQAAIVKRFGLKSN